MSADHNQAKRVRTLVRRAQPSALLREECPKLNGEPVGSKENLIPDFEEFLCIFGSPYHLAYLQQLDIQSCNKWETKLAGD